MLLVVITFLLVAVGVVSYIIGAWQLSRYAARVSGGLGVAVLLLPPVAFWFAFFKLEQEGKEMPTTLWLFGMLSTILLVAVFWNPISMVLTGRMAELDKPAGVAETAVAEYGDAAATEKAAEPAPAEAAAAEAPAGSATNSAAAGTNNAATNNAGTNNAAAGTNSAVGTNAGAAVPAN